METERKAELKVRMEKDSKSWVAVVTNKEACEELGFKVTTNFYSDNDTFENILHKIELDLMTNLHLGLKKSIEVKIAQVH
jgi:hypothetical protein